MMTRFILSPSTGEHRRPQQRAEGPWLDIRLTEGNLRCNHFYLRTAESLLPSDCIGGSNKSDLGRAVRVTFGKRPANPSCRFAQTLTAGCQRCGSSSPILL